MRRDLVAARGGSPGTAPAGGRDAVLLTSARSAAVGFGGTVVGWVIGPWGPRSREPRSADAPVAAVLRESVLVPAGLLSSSGRAPRGAGHRGHGLARSRRGRASARSMLAALAASQPSSCGGGRTRRGSAGGAQGAGGPARSSGPRRVLRRGRRSRLRSIVGSCAGSPGPSPGLGSRTRVARAQPGVGGVSGGVSRTLAFALAARRGLSLDARPRGEPDAAAFSVPLDVVVRQDLSSLVPVLDAAPSSRFAGWRGRGRPRRAGRRGAPGLDVGGVTVLGLPADAVASCRSGATSGDRRRPARWRRRRPAGPGPRGVRCRERASSWAAPGSLPSAASSRSPTGGYTDVELGATRTRAPSDPLRRSRRALRGGSLVALELVPPRLVDRARTPGAPYGERLALRRRARARAQAGRRRRG